MGSHQRVVVVPFTCDVCGKAFEVHCAPGGTFGAMAYYHFECPGCGRRMHRRLPGAIDDIVADGASVPE